MTGVIAEFGEDTDPLAALVLGWLAGKRSVHTRRAYDRDIAGWLERYGSRTRSRPGSK